MFEIVVIISCAFILILLKIFLNIKIKNIKNMKQDADNKLEILSEKFPDDKEICKDILKILNNNDVKIKIDNTYGSCVYTVFNNTITIGKFQQKYMKLQTIAHECIHSCQNKVTLWSNFIFTNIYLIYFLLILIFLVFNKLPHTDTFITIFIFFSLLQYILRNSLENEAMIKAKFIAKEYIESKELLNQKDKEKLLKEYDRVNEIGIPFINFYTISANIIKIIILSIASLI